MWAIAQSSFLVVYTTYADPEILGPRPSADFDQRSVSASAAIMQSWIRVCPRQIHCLSADPKSMRIWVRSPHFTGLKTTWKRLIAATLTRRPLLANMVSSLCFAIFNDCWNGNRADLIDYWEKLEHCTAEHFALEQDTSDFSFIIGSEDALRRC